MWPFQFGCFQPAWRFKVHPCCRISTSSPYYSPCTILWMHASHWGLSFTNDKHFGRYHRLAIISNLAINILTQVLVWTCFQVWGIYSQEQTMATFSKNIIYWLWICLFLFILILLNLKKCEIAFCSDCNIAHPYSPQARSSLSVPLSALAALCISAIPAGARQHLTVLLILISSMATKDESRPNSHLYIFTLFIFLF